jgi:hypothetical protein
MARKDFTALIQPFVTTPPALLNPTYTALTGFTGISYPSTGRETVAIINGATASNYTINVGSLVVGQGVIPFGPTALPVSNTAPVFLPPFGVAYYQPGTNLIFIDFSSVVTVTVAILQYPGVF